MSPEHSWELDPIFGGLRARKEDPSEMLRLRKLLAGEQGSHQLTSMDDDQVLQQVAGLIESGRLPSGEAGQQEAPPRPRGDNNKIDVPEPEKPAGAGGGGAGGGKGAPKVDVSVSPKLSAADPKLVLVKKDYQTKPGRLRVDLTTSDTFQGKGTLDCAQKAKIKVFDAEKAGKEIALPFEIPGPKLTKGIAVFIQGAAASGAVDDVELKLTIDGGPAAIKDNPASDKITCVELQLDLFKVKAATGGADPAALTDAEKISPGRYLHLQNEHLHAGRALMVVRKAKPAAFAKKLQLKPIDERVRAFSDVQEVPAPAQAAQPNPLLIVNSTIDGAKGKRFWIEGAAVSKDLKDTGFTIGLEDLPDQEGDRVTVTVFKAKLDVGQSRKKAGADPEVLARDKRIDPGRYLHLQDADNQHGRASVRVPRVEPKGLVGDLEIVVWNPTAKDTSNPKLKLYAAEAPGGAALALPKVINHTATTPAAGDAPVWAEGAAVSTKLLDSELRLRLKDAEGFADATAFTVVQMEEIKAKIKSTPAITQANGDAMNPPVAPPPDYDLSTKIYKEAFADNPPLVLMRNSQPDVELKVIAKPDKLPIEWDVIRNPDDASSLGKAKDIPTITPDGAKPKEAKLNTDNKGSFRVRPYIDCNGTGTYSPGEPSIPLNLVLADAKVKTDLSAGHTKKLTSAIFPAFVNIENGAWQPKPLSDAALLGAGMAMECEADVTGGGADGKLGLDMVFAGLINDLIDNQIVATYHDAVAVPAVDIPLKNIYVSNRTDATIYGTDYVFKTGDPAAKRLTWPLLDTGVANHGTGGCTACMSRSEIHSKTDLKVGQRWLLRCIDSPGRGFDKTHPINANAVLTHIEYVQKFQANFCFWTNKGKTNGATGDIADRLYTVLLQVPWEIVGAWDVDYAAAPPTLKNTTKHEAIADKGSRTRLKPIGRVEDNQVEVRPPAGISTTFAWDSR